MKIRMQVQISGNRNGKAWPDKGGVIDLPEAEAAQLCAAGMAETVKGDTEKAVPAKAETTEPEKPAVTEKPAPEKRGPGRPRKNTQ